MLLTGILHDGTKTTRPGELEALAKALNMKYSDTFEHIPVQFEHSTLNSMSSFSLSILSLEDIKTRAVSESVGYLQDAFLCGGKLYIRVKINTGVSIDTKYRSFSYGTVNIFDDKSHPCVYPIEISLVSTPARSGAFITTCPNLKKQM